MMLSPRKSIVFDPHGGIISRRNRKYVCGDTYDTLVELLEDDFQTFHYYHNPIGLHNHLSHQYVCIVLPRVSRLILSYHICA